MEGVGDEVIGFEDFLYCDVSIIIMKFVNML